MMIKEQVVDHLEALVNDLKPNLGQKSAAEHTILIKNQGIEISLKLADCDRYSATLSQLEVGHTELTIATTEIETYLCHHAAEIIQRLLYLDEPLALLEMNKVDGVAQLRSDPPLQKAEHCLYWEVLITLKPHPKAVLSRYQWQAGLPKRQHIAYPATYATLGRLSQDLGDSLSTSLPKK